jgi:hypothetical protein
MFCLPLRLYVTRNVAPMNYKELEKERSCGNFASLPIFAWSDCGKQCEAIVSIADVPTEF